MIYITGDKHLNFSKVREFCQKYQTTRDDLLIVLGDSGMNYHVDRVSPTENRHYRYANTGNSLSYKTHLSKFPITFFFIQGNHEAPAKYVSDYIGRNKFGGTVFIDERYPNQIFSDEYGIYDFGEKGKWLVLGGAYSVDKDYRLFQNRSGNKNARWFPEEQMINTVKEKVIRIAETYSNDIDGILSHTCREGIMPKHLFLNYPTNPDNSMEAWLEKVHNVVDYKKWYCGHFHGDEWLDDKTLLMYDDIRELLK